MNHPALPWHPDNLNDSRCNSSSTEARALVAITDPSHRRYVLSLEGGFNPPLLYPQEKREPVYLSGGFSSMKSWCPPRGMKWIDRRDKFVFIRDPCSILLAFWA
ncbi:hypothetical protein AVEN_72192-1 [Araneus ventricosus]|uniref:Uncharacterized protein n=1 Tax=Araneus ventricosus TaxID=182803 RepID=A0A4Y2EIJ2_ARAVE|nr:hypothetical protein AVEN_72192-1 [Araneus ventricosus]